MKIFYLSTIAAAVLSITSTVQADANSSFVTDSTLDATFKTVYFFRDFSETTPEATKVEQFVQGGRLDFQSGYIADWIGFDASLYSAVRLNDSDGNSRSEVVELGDDNKLKSGYSKLGQALIKVKFGDEYVNGSAKYGRQVVDNILLNGFPSRANPSAYSGITGQLNIGPLELNANRITQTSTRYSNGFSDFVTVNTNQKIENLRTLRATYHATSDLEFEIGIGESKDYLRQRVARATWQLEPKDGYQVTLDARAFRAEPAGNLALASGSIFEKLSQTGNAEDYKSTWYNLTAGVDVGNWSSKLTYGRVDGDTYNFLWAGNSDYSPTNSFQDLNTNFLADQNGRSLLGHLFYSFDEGVAKGLTAGIIYGQGEFDDGQDKGLEAWERLLVVSYDVPAVEGLNFTWVGTQARNDGDGAFGLNSGDATDQRVYMNYSVNIF
ncbi:OprD family outer membrane porin [Pelagibaculum spongiae]|uniref:Outer membrane porin, OprD family n=1 Tax=Pelagibaculum spongiae TaxID=2080658 RepID=A0A2V1H6W0_9GAMM|nr:OprD family outer membrane porin [Pelagibaculum spongiae]PVZ72515.1 hypothetical protein DC094_05805 [Pelagibaculum spongiae]